MREGVPLEHSMAPEVETTLVNAVLTNGARFYVDHAHPEISIPEVRTAREAVVWDRAADEIVRRAMVAATSMLPDGAEIVIHKNNSDGKGNSYGCHENYLVDRELPFGRLTRQITPHFVTRQVFCGAGKVGCELPGRIRCRRSVPDSGSVPTSSKRRSASRPRSSGRSSTRATNRMPIR